MWIIVTVFPYDPKLIERNRTWTEEYFD